VSTRQILLLSSGILGGGLALASVAATPVTLGLAALLIAAGGGLFHPILIAHHARLLPGEPGQATAGFYLGFDLGIGLGSWLLGAMLDLGGLFWMYALATALVALTVPLVPILTGEQSKTASSAAR
jgi:predicted MFS family arabinose efflux permease